MPEFSEWEIGPTEEGSIVDRFEQFLDEHSPLMLRDLDNIEMVIYIRLRSLLTRDQMHQRAHAILVGSEQLLHTEGALTDEHGNPVAPTLVENFEGGIKDVIAMNEKTEVDDDDIAAFLTQFGREEEE